MPHIPHIKSSQNVTVFIDGTDYIIPSNTPQYDLVITAITAGDIEAVRSAVEIRKEIVKVSQGLVTLEGSRLMYNGRPIHGALTDRILAVLEEAGNVAPLLTFLENLMQNPSKRAVDELYSFLSKCDLPITDDGHFLAYKRVRSDYTDVHSGTFDNSVGKICEMPRNAVDDDRNRTCSAGLHFCSKSYLAHFGGERIVVVKINPADVVSIPADYNDAKGRCWRYEVVDELSLTDTLQPLEDIKSGYTSSYGQSVAQDDDELDEDDDNDDIELSEEEVVQILSNTFGIVAPAPLATSAPPVSAPTLKTSYVAGLSLTDQQVRDIRGMLAEEWPLASIARAIGTSARTVARIRDGETYTHVK
ncbi:protein rIIB [Xanthomonas phage Xoo-sp13]|nr:protein rIIB [Xanthomonas phage Xoo-sp13]